jgi:hypothetical protein
MSKVRAFAGAHIALILVASAPASLLAAPAKPVSFSRNIIPLLKARCAVCHMTGTEPGQIALVPKSAFLSLVGVPSIESKLMRVQAGDPEGSYFLHKLKGTHRDVGGSGARMPLAAPPLDASTIADIEAWIAAGAKVD